MNDILNWFKTTFENITLWFNETLDGLLNWFESLPLVMYEHFLNGIAETVLAIQPPEFVQTGLQSVISYLPSDVGYFLAMSGLAQGFAILGTAHVYSYLRKLIPFAWS